MVYDDEAFEVLRVVLLVAVHLHAKREVARSVCFGQVACIIEQGLMDERIREAGAQEIVGQVGEAIAPPRAIGGIDRDEDIEPVLYREGRLTLRCEHCLLGERSGQQLLPGGCALNKHDLAGAGCQLECVRVRLFCQLRRQRADAHRECPGHQLVGRCGKKRWRVVFVAGDKEESGNHRGGKPSEGRGAPGRAHNEIVPPRPARREGRRHGSFVDRIMGHMQESSRS